MDWFGSMVWRGIRCGRDPPRRSRPISRSCSEKIGDTAKFAGATEERRVLDQPGAGRPEVF